MCLRSIIFLCTFGGSIFGCGGGPSDTGIGTTPTVVVNAYAVTPSAGINGIIDPSTVQMINRGARGIFTVTPIDGFVASVGGTCGGTLVGSTYTTDAIAGPCTVIAIFATNNPNADFAARCSAPGVTICSGMDTEASTLADIGTAFDNTRQGFIDTGIKTSGAGSLRFTLRAGVSDQNIGGYWETPLGATFSVGDTIYVQYRFRASPEYFSNAQNYWRSSIKQINIHGPSSTCQGAEFATVIDNKLLSLYNNCGDGFSTNVNTNALQACGSGDCLLQQGSSLAPSPNGSGYNCHYQNQFSGLGDGDGCFWPLPNKWYTIFEKIFVGQFGGSTSAVDAYVAVDGGPYKQFQRAAGIFFNPNRDNNFTNMRFETYMTEIRGAAPTYAYIWYDELIVSKLPIAAPGN